MGNMFLNKYCRVSGNRGPHRCNFILSTFLISCVSSVECKGVFLNKLENY
jgi:hypothetical protein